MERVSAIGRSICGAVERGTVSVGAAGFTTGLEVRCSVPESGGKLPGLKVLMVGVAGSTGVLSEGIGGRESIVDSIMGSTTGIEVGVEVNAGVTIGSGMGAATGAGVGLVVTLRDGKSWVRLAISTIAKMGAPFLVTT